MTSKPMLFLLCVAGTAGAASCALGFSALARHYWWRENGDDGDGKGSGGDVGGGRSIDSDG